MRDNPLVVEKNRNLFKSYINADIKWLNRNHTNIAKSFDECENEQCDSVFTDKPKQFCTVLTADCLPALIFEKSLQKSLQCTHAGRSSK